MKRIKPEVFKETADGFELHGDLNYPTFFKTLLLRPVRTEKNFYKGEVTWCRPIFTEKFYEDIAKYNIKKVKWGGLIKVLTKDLVDYE